MMQAISSCKECNFNFCIDHWRAHADLTGDHRFLPIPLLIHPAKYLQLALQVKSRIDQLQGIENDIVQFTSSIMSRIRSWASQALAPNSTKKKHYTSLLDTSHLTPDGLKSIDLFLDNNFKRIPLQVLSLQELDNFYSQAFYKEFTEAPEFDLVKETSNFISENYQFSLDQYYQFSLDQYTSIDKIAIASDGVLAVVAGSDFIIKIFDLQLKREKASLTGHTKRINAICIAIDSMSALTAGADKTVRVWDLINKRQDCVLAGHSDKIFCIATTPDCKKAITGGMDLKLFVWDLTSKRLEYTLKGNIHFICRLLTTSDGKFVVSIEANDDVRVWHLGKKKPKVVLSSKKQAELWIERYPKMSRFFRL